MIPHADTNIWEHSHTVRELYTRRAEGHDEMDASAQCADTLADFITAKNSQPKLLDAGCGSGYLYHSFLRRGLSVEYYGLDYSPSLIAIGRQIMPRFGLDCSRLKVGSIEDLHSQRYDIICLINTLTFCPDFRAPLDRLMGCDPDIILIRDNFGERTVIRWEEDGYLDDAYNHLKAYWNQWSINDLISFMERGGYKVTLITDRRTKGQKEMVVGKPYYWSWLKAQKI